MRASLFDLPFGKISKEVDFAQRKLYTRTCRLREKAEVSEMEHLARLRVYWRMYVG